MSAIYCDTQSAAVAIVELSDEQRHDIRKTIESEWCIRNCDDEWDYAEGLVDCNVPPHEAQNVRNIMQQRGADYYLSTEVYDGDLRLVAPLEHVAAYLVDVTVQWAMAHYSEDGSDAEEIVGDITETCSAIDEVLKDREVYAYDPTRDYDGVQDYLKRHYGETYYARILNGLRIVTELDIASRNWTCEGLRNVSDWDSADDPACLRLYRAKWIRLQDPALGLSGCQYNELSRNAWDYFLEDLADACLEERCRLQHLEDEGKLDEDDDIDDLVDDFLRSIRRKAEELREDTHLDWT